LAQSQLPKHGHAPRKELIGGGTYLEVEEEIPWGPSRQFPMKGRSSRRKFPKELQTIGPQGCHPNVSML